MELLFKREQTSGKMGRVAFKLWSKIELDDDEQALVRRYKFDESILLFEETPNLIRNSALLGVGAAIVAYTFFDLFLPGSVASILALIAFGGIGYWWYHDKRETIFVRDLMYGRHSTCHSIIDLAKKEARLTGVVEIYRQVMESAKHWDGTERHTIEALPKEEARRLVASI